MDAPMPNLKLQNNAQIVENSEVTNKPEQPMFPTAAVCNKNTSEPKLSLLQQIEELLDKKRANKRKYSVSNEEETKIPIKRKMFASKKACTELLSDILSIRTRKFTRTRVLIVKDQKKNKIKLKCQVANAFDLQGVTCAIEEIFPNATFDHQFLSFILIWSYYSEPVVKPFSIKVDESTEVDDRNDLLSFTASVDISNKQTLKIYSQIRNYLMALANEHATDTTNAKVTQILRNEHVPIELLINYRRVTETYMKPPFSVAAMKIRMEKIRAQKLAISEEGYFVYVCKKFKVTNKCTKKNNFLWIYEEEEKLAEKGLCSFEYPVESDLFKLPDLFKPNDYENVIPYRQVLIFESTVLQKIIYDYYGPLSNLKFNCANSVNN